MTTTPEIRTLPEAEIKNVELAVSTQRREDVIRKNVLAELGRPTRLLKVAVLPLWGNNFRINVWTGEGGVSIPNSYFIMADDRGDILRSEPPIKKLY